MIELVTALLPGTKRRIMKYKHVLHNLCCLFYKLRRVDIFMVKRIIYASILCIILSAVVTFTAEASDLVLFREYENIPSDKEWTIVFNEKIDGNSVNENSIYILNDFGIKMDSILVVNDNTVTIKPKMLYYPDSTYHLYVMGVKGIDGQRLKEGFYVKFSTERAG